MPLRRAGFVAKLPPWRAPALVVLLSAWTAASEASADEKDTCVRAVERAQNARLDGKLREARDGFVTCARAVCPAAIREDCTRWVADVDASLPSVVIDASWVNGGDVTGMTVLLDGAPLAGAEKGRAIAVDPGEHTFRFEAAGAAPVETRNVIHEGEKNRILHVVFGPSTPEPTPTVAGSTPAAAPPRASSPPGLWQGPVPESAQARPSSRAPISTGVFVFGGFAIAGFVSFAYLGLAGTGQLDSLRSTCGHGCNPSDVTSARNEILLGDILGLVGLAAAGVATWFFLTRPEAPAAAAQTK
jgi:hypothetical protein